MLSIGIDTGGTCTDAVIYDLDTKEILGAGKAPTTKQNLEIGIANALDQLPIELVRQAGNFSLSTTLATNACVENKGCRAKLLVMGPDATMLNRLRAVLADYGINDLSQLIVIEAKPENLFSSPFDPDWEDLEKRIPELFSECDSIGIVQAYPDANGGRFEMTAMRLLKKQLTIPMTIAYDISQESDFMKICASTLLNARLIPLIAEFIEAVRIVMRERGLDVPISIVRSDGTLMSEEMTKTCPVETLLCGPVASVLGGCRLAGEPNAVLVDMGATTTELALVKDGIPVMAHRGIMIGSYRTAIKGPDAHAVSLGGDTAIRFKDGKLYLDSERVIPVSMLADRYGSVLKDIKNLAAKQTAHSRCIHEFYVLQKDISGKKGYTDFEYRLCDALKEKPLITLDLMEKIAADLYKINTRRLEQEGIIMKCGLTPTDIMILRGDFNKYDGKAAKEMLNFVALNIWKYPEEVMDMVYEMVIKRMYKNIGLFLLKSRYPEETENMNLDESDLFMEFFYDQAKRDAEAKDPVPKPVYVVPKTTDQLYEGAVLAEDNNNNNFNLQKSVINFRLESPFPLVGIGAPIRVFLPKVAELLHTEARVPEYAHVANALGAAVANKTANLDLRVIAKYKYGTCVGYTVVIDEQRLLIEQRDDALAFARDHILKEIRHRAEFQGIGRDPEITLDIEEKRIGNTSHGLILEYVLHAKATEGNSEANREKYHG